MFLIESYIAMVIFTNCGIIQGFLVEKDNHHYGYRVTDIQKDTEGEAILMLEASVPGSEELLSKILNKEIEAVVEGSVDIGKNCLEKIYEIPSENNVDW